MALRDTFLNLLGANTPEVSKTTNSVYKSARDFLRNGNRDRLTPTWSDIQMSDRDMYRGYSYAVIQKRSNKVATLAKNNLKTWANQDIVDEFQKKGEDVIHPYLKLIEDSTDFTEKQFWKSISIYMDLAGRYYLGVIRNRIQPLNPNLPPITTDPTKFIMLNPYEIRRVVDKNGIVAGYIERKKDGRYREWPLHQIIEMRELNPFDPENSQWAMTDAAKNAVYTINQSGDYTRQSLNGNIEAPGIITTDVLLDDEDFANFRARITQHVKGEPLFGNGTGAINWNAMQIDLDKAALMDINEINRTELFAVSGTSKTSLGIEQSGTTRETARVQSEQFISDTAQPRLEDIVDFLNLDYKKYYTREYKTTGYYIEVESAVGRDYDTEQKATELKTSQFSLALQLIQSGYTEQSAYQFAEGKIDFEDLELEKDIDKPKNPENPEEGEASPENSPNSPNNGPQSGSGSGNDNNPTSEQNSLETANNDAQDKDVLTTDLNELTPHSELVEKTEGENSLPLHNHEGCTCDHDHKLEHFINEVQEDEGKVVKNEYDKFLQEIREIEKETVDACAKKVDINAFEESDIIGERKRKTLTEKIKNALHRYWWVIFPLFANNSMNKRNEEFDEDIQFIFNNDLQAGVDDNAERVAKGHMQTILNDILEVSNRAYTNVREEAAADLIVEEYKKNPSKFESYFEEEPTRADALKSIRRTDILEVNRKIYEKANKMAFEGYNRRDIVRAIRKEYSHISETRAELIARNETSRAFTHSQYEADKQFLNGIGKMEEAYKRLVSSRPITEQDKICPVCQALIDMGPVPFEQPFLKYGESIEVQNGDKVQIFTANYESIEGGTVHPNCYERSTQVYTNEGWKRVDKLTGKELFWSIDPETKKPEWVKAKAKIEGYAETLLRFQNKNFDMAVTKDHNMYVESKHRTGEHKIGKKEFRPHLKEAQNLVKNDRFYAGVVWEGENPEFIKLGNYAIPTELYCKFMGYYLSEGCANYYNNKNGKYYQGTIGQETYHNKFWEVLEKMPFKVWNGKKAFTFTDESVVKYCMQFGKSYEKYIPDEIKQLSPRLLRVFIDAFVLGDGSKKYSAYSNAWDTTMFTSSIKLRDDLTEVIQKAGYRPTIKLISSKGTQYKGTNYKSNNDVWKISLCNKVYAHNNTIKCEEIEYHDKVYCVELEKNHTLWVMYNGKCWWSGNCLCRYELVFKNSSGEFVKTLNGGKGSGNFGHLGRPGEVGGSGKGEQFVKKDSSDYTILERYVRGDGMDMNRVLRGEIESDFLYEEQIKLMKKATDRELGEEKEVWRSVDASSIFGNIDEITWEKIEGQIVYSDETPEAQSILKGLRDKTLTEKGFMSTTTDKNVAMDWQDFTGASHPVVLHMILPKTAKGIDIAKNTDLEVKDDPQSEIILKAGTKYKIKDFKNEDGQILVEAEFVENSFEDNELKLLNGGKGSGNFGHAGRPGEVGGSAPTDMSVAVSEQRVNAKWLDEHRAFLRSQGYTDSWIDEQIRTVERQELKKKALKAKTVDQFDKIVDEMKAKGHYSDIWWDTIGKATRSQIEAAIERKSKAVTPDQQEAIDDLLSDTGIYMKAGDEKWLRENVPQEMVEHLHNELNKAFELGLSRNLRVQFTTAQQKQGSCTVEGPDYETVLIRLTRNMMSNPEATLLKTNTKGKDGTRWWTCEKGQVQHTITHELGHALVWQALKNQGQNVYQYNSLNSKIVYNAKKAYAGLKDDDTLYDYSSVSKKSQIKLDELRRNEGYKLLSQYGGTNAAETIAESYSNPNYSGFTKEVYNQLIKALKG